MMERLGFKQQVLKSYDQEHVTTMRVLRAFPKDKVDTKFHPKVKSARELAWVFALECYLGTKVWHDEFASKGPSGTAPKPPESWDQLLTDLEKSYAEFRKLIESTSEADLMENVHFFTGPKTMGEITRIDWAWFLLHDQIHHRGQFSVLVRFADGKLPSVYGPTADEPWF